MISKNLMALTLMLYAVDGWSQNTQAVQPVQSIPNPLIKPATFGAAAKQGEGAAKPAEANALPAAPANGQASSPENADLRRQAERRITQEDLNIRQQQLNSPTVPLPLQNLFDQMSVVASFKGAVVLRRVVMQRGSTNAPPAPVEQRPSQTGLLPQIQSSPADASGASANVSSAQVISGPALRLHVGRITNINGYRLRAVVDGLEVTVDWQDDSGRWVNVYAGALQSASGFNPVPRRIELETVQTPVFNYLKPQVSGTTLGPSGGGAGGLGGQGQAGGFGGGLGQNAGGQGGFGSSSGGFGGAPGGTFR